MASSGLTGLSSPGVLVSVSDEDFYATSTTGTIPLIVLATAQNKTSPTGSGIATMTTSANAGKVRLVGSQRELVQNYGSPLFYSSGGSPLHGYELNEYGLHAAYEYLGVANSAYILRADVDVAALTASQIAPSSAPADGTYWLDTAQTVWGLFQSNGNAVAGNAWVSKTVSVLGEENTTSVSGVVTPSASYGNNGDFAVVTSTTANLMFEKTAGTWNRIGSAAWLAAHPTTVRSTPAPTLTSGNTFSINSHTITLTSTVLSDLVTAINTAAAGVTATIESTALVLRSTTGSIVLAAGTGPTFAALGFTAGTTKANSVVFTNNASYPGGSVAGDLWIKGTSSNRGADYALKVYTASTGLWNDVSVPFYPYNSSLTDGNTSKDTAAKNTLQPVAGTIYIGYDSSTTSVELRRYDGTKFVTLSYEASDSAPTAPAADGALWYSADFQADIMVSNGSNYLGYLNMYPLTNPTGPFLQGTAPTQQSDGTALVDNDLWIDTTDLENYPKMYRYSALTSRWLAVDTTDQTSPFGIIFADARQDSGVAFTGQVATGYVYNSTEMADMLVSDYLDPDAPDARTVPSGMLLFNTRYSTYNVKKWVSNYFGYGGFNDNVNYTLTTYNAGGSTYSFPALASAGRWVTISGNRANGSALMGRRAQRAVIVQQMAAAVSANLDIRSEIVNFNLISAPGYPELIDEMVLLNTDIKNTAFVVGDSPARLAATSDDIRIWATNANNASSNGEDGLISTSPNLAVYYPWGLGTNVDGSQVMIPPSTMALMVYATNDQVAYPWYAPAGYQRGVVNNATSVGYLDGSNEYVSVFLSEGMRDTLYNYNVNPIAYIVNKGLVIMAQNTRDNSGGSRQSVNVARLVCYLASNLDALAKPFLFQQNTKQTRDTITSVFTKFLSGIASQNGLDDFAVKVDEENNDATIIDARQLWIDVAIQPTRSIEFILIPLRLTTGS